MSCFKAVRCHSGTDEVGPASMLKRRVSPEEDPLGLAGVYAPMDEREALFCGDGVEDGGAKGDIMKRVQLQRDPPRGEKLRTVIAVHAKIQGADCGLRHSQGGIG